LIHIKQIILISLIGLFIGCAVDPPIYSTGNCDQVVIDSQMHPCIITNFAEGPIQYKAPFFNPIDSSEFVYIEINHDSGYSRLCTFNYVTHQKQILKTDVDDEVQPKWNINNKIIFGVNSKIYLINSNGTGFQQLTFNGLDFWPEWINTDTICFTDNNSGIGASLSITLNHLDTITLSPLVLASVSSNKIIATTNGSRDAPDIIISDIDSLNWKLLPVNTFNSGYDRIEGISWHPNNFQIYYTKYTLGIFMVDILDEKFTQVVSGCFGAWYKFIDISPQGNKIIAEKIITDYENCTYFLNSSIVLMNIDGSGEETILP